MGKMKTTAQFVSESVAVYGDKYDYSKVHYNGNKTKVCIICPFHGEFWQIPKDHLRGHGCRKCIRRDRKIGVFDMNQMTNDPSYIVWNGMIGRCYLNTREKDKSYHSECTICEEWLTFSSFYKWFYNPKNGYQKGLHLDKDILVKGNKEYAPNSCCFVPKEINFAFMKGKANRGKHPIGVYSQKNRYKAAVHKFLKREFIGSFDTAEQAFNAYKVAKEQYIKELAEKYFKEGKIIKKVYDALMKYEVEMTD